MKQATAPPRITAGVSATTANSTTTTATGNPPGLGIKTTIGIGIGGT